MPLTGLTGEWSRGADGTSSSTERVLGERTCRGEVNNSRFYSTGKEHNNRSPLVHLSSSSSLVARRGGVHGRTSARSTGVAHLDQELVFSTGAQRRQPTSSRVSREAARGFEAGAAESSLLKLLPRPSLRSKLTCEVEHGSKNGDQVDKPRAFQRQHFALGLADPQIRNENGRCWV